MDTRKLPQEWLSDTQSAIEAHRGLLDGWDGPDSKAPSSQCLDTAAAVAVAWSELAGQRRPVFTVDVEGRPTFAINTGWLYLHMTVDGPGLISWYSVAGGIENFDDGVRLEYLDLESVFAAGRNQVPDDLGPDPSLLRTTA